MCVCVFIAAAAVAVPETVSAETFETSFWNARVSREKKRGL